MSEAFRGAPSSAGQAGPRRRLDRLVAGSRAALLWERVWPALWLPFGVVLVFVAASWLGLWLDLPRQGRIVGLALFGLAFLGSLWPLLRLRLPPRAAALDRLDRKAGLKHGPARALEDTLAVGAADPATRALWEAHRRRAEAALARLSVAPPRPDMPAHDRYALRGAALLALVASAFVAGPEMGQRLAAAFDWRGPVAPGPVSRIDGWIDPPLYTRSPPLMIDFASGGEQRLKAPIRSTVVIRVAGAQSASVEPGRGLVPLPAPENPRPGLTEQRFTLEGSATLALRTGLTGGARLTIEAIPDRPPEIALADPPEVNARGTFTLSYRAKDDYGIASAEGEIARADGAGQGGRRPLVPAPRLALSPPADAQGEAATRTTLDLTQHPWAGARVALTLLARDEAGQEGRSEPLPFTLPQRPFTKPLARALVEQRRNLVLDPDDRRQVQLALDALLIAPERYTPQWGVFLGLRLAAQRLRAARTDEALLEVADWLWTMAQQIEDGDLSEAERDLRAAQERLREALERNAGEDEIRRLTQELRQAMDRFLREFAERMQRDPQSGEQPSRPGDRIISQEDLNRMLNQIEEMMRQGDVAEAQRLLDQLRNTLENLQTARPNGRMTDPMAREMNRAIEDLDGIVRDQQQLRDDTFRQGQEGPRGGREERRGQQRQGDRQGNREGGRQGQQGEAQGQQRQGQRGEGRQPGGGQGQGQGEQGAGQGLDGRQQALRDRLNDLQRRMRGLGLQGEQGFSEAEQAMREAENAIRDGRSGEAVEAQGRALEGLQRGTQGLAQQMQQMMGQGDGSEQAGEPGQGQPDGRSANSQRNSDPLGRPLRSRDLSDGRVKVPTADESAAARTRRIMEELRRKLGDPNRPREELDYFDRLLRRN